MADRNEILQPLRPALVPVPAPDQFGICPICHSSRDDRYSTCFPCAQAAHLDPPAILPVTMSIARGAVHHHLRMYKDAPDSPTRHRLTMRIAALLSLFMERHEECVGPWDVVTCVPSSARVALLPVVAKLKCFYKRDAQLLTARPGAGSRLLDPEQFAASEAARGARVLLLDDTFTTGAKLFSAVAALRSAGATVVGPVVLGRHVEPAWEPSREMLTWLAERPWAEERCCRCGGERRDEGSFL